MSDETARIWREQQLAEMSESRARAEQLAYWQELPDGALLSEMLAMTKEVQRYVTLATAMNKSLGVAMDVAKDRGLLR